MSTKDYMFIRSKNSSFIKVRFEDIYFIKSLGDYIQIFTSNDNGSEAHTIHYTIKGILEKLPQHIFCRCHRGIIVNVDKIIRIERDTACIAGREVLIGREFRKGLLDKVNFLPSRHEKNRTEKVTQK